MPKKNIVFLFHLYQPPWQERSVFLDFYSNRYEPLITFFENNPTCKVTFNFTGSLTEIFIKEKKFELIDRIRLLVDRKQVELVGTAMYHPILPLIPNKEIVRQIHLNETINSKYFKEQWTSNILSGRGFYLPEIAYSNESLKIIHDLGFKWITIDRSSIDYYAKIDWTVKYKEKNTKTDLLIRNSYLYNDNTLSKPIIENDNLIFIEDGEDKLIPTKDNLYWNIKLKNILGKDILLNYMTSGEYFLSLSSTNINYVDLNNGNWEITEDEYLQKSFYHIWDNKNDELHQLLWNLINDILELVHKQENDKNNEFIRNQLDMALSSCTWWWVDGRFNGYYPTAIQKGLDIMINTIRSFDKLELDTRLKFEKIYSQILYKIWERHWKKSL